MMMNSKHNYFAFRRRRPLSSQEINTRGAEDNVEEPENFGSLFLRRQRPLTRTRHINLRSIGNLGKPCYSRHTSDEGLLKHNMHIVHAFGILGSKSFKRFSF